MYAELIPKETIPNYKIIRIKGKSASEFRVKLQNAARLGNEFKSKVILVFQTEEGPKQVETTVWAVTENYIQLKSGMYLPIQSILDVRY